MPYTSDDLVADIQRDSMLTTAQRNFTPAQLLAIADQELMTGIAPMLVSLTNGFFEEDADTTCVVGQSRYDFNQYAMWTKLRRLELLDLDGEPRELSQITAEQAYDYAADGTGFPTAFEFEANQVVLYPTPDQAYTLRQKIYRRPGRMVTQQASRTIVALNTGTGVVTYDSNRPLTFTAGSTHDVYRSISPFRRAVTATQATATPAANQQTFPLAAVALMQVGDVVCVTQETIYPAIPLELSPHLKDLVIASLARTQNDAQSYQIQRQKIIDNARSEMTAPGARSVGQPKRVSIPMHRVNPGYGRRRWWW